jgi:hypothetical protein
MTNPKGDSCIKPMPTGSYNAELVKQLSPEIQAKIKHLGTPIHKTVKFIITGLNAYRTRMYQINSA